LVHAGVTGTTTISSRSGLVKTWVRSGTRLPRRTADTGGAVTRGSDLIHPRIASTAAVSRGPGLIRAAVPLGLDVQR
jgi:hypothetical protein